MRIGVDLGGTKIEGIVLDDRGTALCHERIPTPQGRYEETIAAVRDLVFRLETSAGRRASVGIGMPGSISQTTGLVQNANSVWLNGRPFAEDVAAALAREVRIANDANCFALSEAIDGAALEHRVVFGVILGTGVGGGIVCDRSIWRGRQSIAGEWGHNEMPHRVTEDLPAPPCYCGRTGCIETYLSGPALARTYASQGGEPLDARAVALQAAAGEPLALQAMDRFYSRLAKSLASVINLLDPDVIVVGGGLSNIDAIYHRVPELLPAFVFADAVTTPIKKNLHGDSSGVRGAAWLWPLQTDRSGA